MHSPVQLLYTNNFFKKHGGWSLQTGLTQSIGHREIRSCPPTHPIPSKIQQEGEAVNLWEKINKTNFNRF